MVAGSRKDENNFGWDRLVEVMAGVLCVGLSFIGESLPSVEDLDKQFSN
jgi:hypothetical protein